METGRLSIKTLFCTSGYIQLYCSIRVKLSGYHLLMQLNSFIIYWIEKSIWRTRKINIVPPLHEQLLEQSLLPCDIYCYYCDTYYILYSLIYFARNTPTHNAVIIMNPFMCIGLEKQSDFTYRIMVQHLDNTGK